MSWNGNFSNLSNALRNSFTKLRRAPVAGSPSAWTSGMSVTAIVAFILSIALALTYDPHAVVYFREALERGDPTSRFLVAVTDLGKSEWYIIISLFVIIAAGFIDWTRFSASGKVRISLIFGQAGFLFLAISISGILVNVAKFFIGRGRPRMMDEFGPYSFQPFGIDSAFLSYPSGHSTTIGALALVLMLWFPRFRATILAVALILGFSRVVALAHYPSDVVAGLTFGFLCALFIARWLAKRSIVFRFAGNNLMPVPRFMKTRS